MSTPLAPPAGELRIVDDVPRAFAAVVREEASPAARARFSLVLSGGSTARQCYEELATTSGIDWERIEVLIGDERCVRSDDSDANQLLIRTSLLDKVGPVGAFHPMDCADPGGYASIVRARAPLGLVHLGLGPDGHTASLFPGSAAIDAPPGALVVSNRDPYENNPHDRLTFTFEAIALARLAVFTVSGPDKHAALHRLLTGEAIPAARVRAGRVLWLCDRAAVGSDIDAIAAP